MTEFKSMGIRPRDHMSIDELAVRYKMKRYQIIHMLLEEHHEQRRELMGHYNLTPNDFNAVRETLRAKIREINAEAKNLKHVR
jgi:hypothetical protein